MPCSIQNWRMPASRLGQREAVGRLGMREEGRVEVQADPVLALAQSIQRWKCSGSSSFALDLRAAGLGVAWRAGCSRCLPGISA